MDLGYNACNGVLLGCQLCLRFARRLNCVGTSINSVKSSACNWSSCVCPTGYGELGSCARRNGFACVWCDLIYSHCERLRLGF